MLLTANFGTANTGRNVYYRVIDGNGNTTVARTSSGVTELVAGSGLYAVTLDAATVQGRVIVWDIDGTAKTAAESVPDAISVSVPTVSEIDAQLSLSHGSGLWQAQAQGPGSTAAQIVVTDSVSGLPLDGVAVWISTDLSGLDVVAGTVYTNMQGAVTVLLDTGTYYLWRQRSGVNFSNPEQITI